MSKDRAASLQFRQLAGELIAGGLRFRFQARGRSMLPTIQDGEMLHVEPIGKNNLKVGDIVLLRWGTEFKAHRIVRKRGQIFTTRGDAGMEPDGEIPENQILGKIIAKECLESDRVIRLDGPGARLKFFAFEGRRRVSAFKILLLRLKSRQKNNQI